MSASACQMAQNLARTCGYCVFPVLTNKAPATPNGFLDAEVQPDAIAKLWQCHPGPLIGIATGSEVWGVRAGRRTQEAGRPTRSRRSSKSTRQQGGGGEETPAAFPLPGSSEHAQAACTLCSSTALVLASVKARSIRASIPGANSGYAVWWYAAGNPCHRHEPPAPWPDWLYEH